MFNGLTYSVCRHLLSSTTEDIEWNIKITLHSTSATFSSKIQIDMSRTWKYMYLCQASKKYQKEAGKT